MDELQSDAFNPHKIFPRWSLWLYSGTAIGLMLVNVRIGFSEAVGDGVLFASLAVFVVDLIWFVYPLVKMCHRLGDEALQKVAGAWLLLYVSVGTFSSLMLGLEPGRWEVMELLTLVEMAGVAMQVVAQIILVGMVYLALIPTCRSYDIKLRPVVLFFGLMYGYPKYIVDQIADRQPDGADEADDFGVMKLFGLAIQGGWAIIVACFVVWQALRLSNGCM